MPSRPLENASQDWSPMVLSKSGQQRRAENTEQQRNMSKQSSSDANAKKLDKATEAGKIEMLPRGISTQLLAGRVAKKMSQKDLATQLNIPVKTIQEIETHKYKRDMALAQRMAKKLGIVLTK
tara:strand:+ start:273 stop:641 length:369 start_codon:yes stop_codon:yes gene_type:complete